MLLQAQPGEFANLAQLWEAGGWAMYPLTLLMLLGGVAALLALLLLAVDKRGQILRPVAWTLPALGLLTIAVGAGARASALSTLEEAIGNVNPRDAQTILAYGRAEAQVPWRYGLLIGTPLFMLGGGLLLIRRKKPQTGDPVIQATRVP